MEFVFDEGPDDAGRSFRPQGNRILPLVDERVHLLFDDIGCITDGAGKKFGFFKHRNPYFGKSVRLENTPGGRFHMLPFPDLAGKYVIESFNAG